MFDYDDDCENGFHRFEFIKRAEVNGVNEFIKREISGEKNLPELLAEFKWFLNSAGFTYVDAITAHSPLNDHSSEDV